MENAYIERKNRQKARYQERKGVYEKRYKAGKTKTIAEKPAPVEEKVEEEIQQKVSVEEEMIGGEDKEDIDPKIQASTGGEFLGSVLTNIEGIGASRASKLEAVGIKTLEDLAKANPSEISMVVGVSDSQASGWIKKAETG